MYHRRYKLIEPRGGESSSSSVLGEGAYGIVFKAMDLLQGNKMVALKKIKAEGDIGGISSSALREITLLMQLDHTNVVKLENVLIERERVSLIFELVDTDLKKYMDSSKHELPVDLVQSYTVQLLEALSYCHSMGVMHRDVKPQNILVTKDGQLKLCDFGLARSFTPHGRPLTQEVVTKWYRPPEILLGSNMYDSSVDIWSAACVIAEMSRKRPLFLGDSDIQLIHLIFSILGTPSAAQWPGIERLPHWRNSYPNWKPQSLHHLLPRLPLEAVSLLQRMFEYDPCRRASAIEALHSPFCIPYRTDFSMEPFFPFEGIQKFPSGSPSLQSGPGSPVAQYFRQPTVTPTTTSEMETAAPDSSTTYPHQHSIHGGSGGGGSSSSSSISGGSASTNRFGADVMNERSSIEPQHRRGMSKATSFQCIFNKVTPEPTEECAASDPQDMMMKHYEGDRPNDILVAELSQTIRVSRSALEAENNDLMLSVLGGSSGSSSSRPHRKNGDANAISPLARSDSFADISARYDLPNSVPCLVASGSSYRHADGHSHSHSLVVDGGGSHMDNLKDLGADENAVSNGQLARKLSLHYPIDEDALAERDGNQKEKASLTLIVEEKKPTHVQDALGKRPLNQMKRRNQPIQDLFEPPLKKQGALTQPGHLWNSKACLREEMDLSIRSDIDEPALEVTVVDKLKRVKRSSKPADQPPSSASVSLQRPCTRGTKKL